MFIKCGVREKETVVLSKLWGWLPELLASGKSISCTEFCSNLIKSKREPGGRGAHTHIKRHVHIQTQTHTHTQHPTKSPFTNLTFQGHTWDDARFSLPLFIPRLLPSASYDICYIQRHKVIWLTKPSTPATTKPKHTLSPTETVTKQRVIFSEQFDTQLYTLLELSCPALLWLSFSSSFLWTQHSSLVTGFCWSIIFPYFHVIKTTSTSFSHEWNYLEHYF